MLNPKVAWNLFFLRNSPQKAPSDSLSCVAVFAAARRFFHENLSLQARKLAKLWRQNSQR
jgi:hypothetical protein